MPPFGDKLKKARETRGITLDDVSLTTKIGTRFLRAMEEEHFEQLPGGIFNKGFVRAYARCVGIDEDQTVADYLIASGEVLPKKVEAAEPVPIQAVKAPPQKATAAKATVAKATAAKTGKAKEKEVVRERVRIIEESRDDPGSGANFPWAPVASLIVVVALGLAIWHFVARGSTAGSAGSAGSAAPAASTAIPKPSPPVPMSSGGAPDSPAAVQSSSPAPGSFVVLIRASEESWISIQADDKPIVEVMLEASEQQSVEAHSKIEVKIGNLAGTDLWFNGKKLDVQGEEGEVRTVTFDAHGLRPQESTPRPADAPVPSP